MRSHNGSNGTPLEPPIFWLDNIFKNCVCNAAILKVPIRENFDLLFLHVHHQNASLGRRVSDWTKKTF
jgi:hypothetical protein